MFISTGCCLLNLMAAKIIAVSGFQIIYEIFIIFEIAALIIFLFALQIAKGKKKFDRQKGISTITKIEETPTLFRLKSPPRRRTLNHY